MTVIRANFGDLNNANFYKIAFQGYTDHPMVYDQIFNVKDSKRATEYISAVSGLALPDSKAEGADITTLGWDSKEVDRLMSMSDEIGSIDKSESSSNLQPRWDVLVVCATEQEQRELLERLLAEGKECRALIA